MYIKAVGLVVSEKKMFLVFPIVSLWDLSVAMETTILIQSAPKPDAINPPTQLWFTLNLIKIGLLASEIFFFEIVDGRRTDDDGRQMPAYPISSPVSLRNKLYAKHIKCKSSSFEPSSITVQSQTPVCVILRLYNFFLVNSAETEI